jgi:transposase-like protein
MRQNDKFDLAAFEAMLRRRSEHDTRVSDLCRAAGISKQTYYNWRRRYQRLRIEKLVRERRAAESLRNLHAILSGLSLARCGEYGP